MDLKAIAANDPVKMMVVGYPGAGKTGALASLANAGFRLRIIDFDGNLAPLIRYARPDADIDVVPCEDRVRFDGRITVPVGKPEAYEKAWKIMDRWTYKKPDGSVVDLGRSCDWGPDTVVVLDGFTAMGAATLRHVLFMSNRTLLNNTDGIWQIAMNLQDSFIDTITASSVRHHVLVLAHLKLVGPPDVRKGDSDMTAELKKQVAELVETRLYPSALGRQLPPVIGGHFPILIEAAVEKLPGDKVRRVLRAVPRPELDLKFPGPPGGHVWDIGTGLAEIFKLLGHDAPKLLGHDAPKRQEGAGAKPSIGDGK